MKKSILLTIAAVAVVISGGAIAFGLRQSDQNRQQLSVQQATVAANTETVSQTASGNSPSIVPQQKGQPAPTRSTRTS